MAVKDDIVTQYNIVAALRDTAKADLDTAQATADTWAATAAAARTKYENLDRTAGLLAESVVILVDPTKVQNPLIG